MLVLGEPLAPPSAPNTRLFIISGSVIYSVSRLHQKGVRLPQTVNTSFMMKTKRNMMLEVNIQPGELAQPGQ